MIPGNNGIIMQTATAEFVGFQHLMFGLRDSLAADFKIFCAPGQPDLVVVSWGCHCLLLGEEVQGTEASRTCMSALGGSWVVTSGVISPLRKVMTIGILLITLLITTHEPPCKE